MRRVRAIVCSMNTDDRFDLTAVVMDRTAVNAAVEATITLLHTTLASIGHDDVVI